MRYETLARRPPTLENEPVLARVDRGGDDAGNGLEIVDRLEWPLVGAAADDRLRDFGRHVERRREIFGRRLVDEDQRVVFVEVGGDLVPLVVGALRAVVRHLVERLGPLVMRLELRDGALGAVAVAADLDERVAARARRKRRRRFGLARGRLDGSDGHEDETRQVQQPQDHIAMITERGEATRSAAIALDVRYHDRRAARIENDAVRVTVLREGGHIAEILDKATGVNPLWTPPWTSIEPSSWHAAHPDFGSGADARLLAGIMGHNLCLDIFGGPSDEEAAAGMSAHGDASVAAYEIAADGDALVMRARLPLAQAIAERRIALDGPTARVRETITNLAAIDRPIGWTEHVTLGPPFLRKGATEFRASATRSRVFESAFGAHDYLQAGAGFQRAVRPAPGRPPPVRLRPPAPAPASSARSEERRVGKEGRSRAH